MKTISWETIIKELDFTKCNENVLEMMLWDLCFKKTLCCVDYQLGRGRSRIRKASWRVGITERVQCLELENLCLTASAVAGKLSKTCFPHSDTFRAVPCRVVMKMKWDNIYKVVGELCTNEHQFLRTLLHLLPYIVFFNVWSPYHLHQIIWGTYLKYQDFGSDF